MTTACRRPPDQPADHARCGRAAGGVEHHRFRIHVEPQPRLFHDGGRPDDGELTNGLAHHFAQVLPAWTGQADDPRRQGVNHGAPFWAQAAGGFGGGDGLAGRGEPGGGGLQIDCFTEDVGATGDHAAEVKADPHGELDRGRRASDCPVDREGGVGRVGVT